MYALNSIDTSQAKRSLLHEWSEAISLTLEDYIVFLIDWCLFMLKH